MADREHEEWLRDEMARKQLSVAHRVALIKKRSLGDEKKRSDAESDEAQEVTDDADDAADERDAQEREGGWETGNAV